MYLVSRLVQLILLLSVSFVMLYSIYEYQSKEYHIKPEPIPYTKIVEVVSKAEEHSIPWIHLAAVHSTLFPNDLDKLDEIAKLMQEEDVFRKKYVEEYVPPIEIYQAFYTLFPLEAANIKKQLKTYQHTVAPLVDIPRFPFLKEDVNQLSYVDSWGASRTYGGNRKHEGTDLMAPKGMKIVSVSDAIVVRKGWNRLGGWAITLKDTHNPHISYYYAHLSSYAEGLVEGEKVVPGQVIGYVGDSGYGPEGTTGQFAPHLHFGIYVSSNWLSYGNEAVNPFSYLKLWQNKL